MRRKKLTLISLLASTGSANGLECLQYPELVEGHLFFNKLRVIQISEMRSWIEEEKLNGKYKRRFNALYTKLWLGLIHSITSLH